MSHASRQDPSTDEFERIEPPRGVNWTAAVIIAISVCLTLLTLAFMSMGDTESAMGIVSFAMLVGGILAFATRNRWS
jgi:hypothetical protein